MDKNKKITGILIAGVILVGLSGYWFYLERKPAVAPSGNVENKPATSAKSLIPEIFPSGKATLSWNTNTEPNLAGYKIYYGANPRTGDCPPGGYPQKVDVGNKISYTIDKLEKGKTYHFSITAYNKSGKESCFSAEVKKIIQ